MSQVHLDMRCVVSAALYDDFTVVELLLQDFGSSLAISRSHDSFRDDNIMTASGRVQQLGKYFRVKGMDAGAGQIWRALQRLNRDFVNPMGLPSKSLQLLRLVAAPGMGKVGITVVTFEQSLRARVVDVRAVYSTCYLLTSHTFLIASL